MGTIDAEGDSFNALSGAFYRIKNSAWDHYPNEGSGVGDLVGFDASLSNQKFGLTNTIQPNSGYALIIMKA